MKQVLYLIFAVSLLTTIPLQAQDNKQAQTLLEQAQKALFSNPKQASYYAAQAAALFPEDEPNETRAQAMILYCQAEQLLGNFDLSIKNLYDTQRYINPANKRQTAQLYSLMGRVYSKLGDYNKGIELNDKATSIFKSLGDSASVAGCYNERGVMHYLLDEFLVAERFQSCPKELKRDCYQSEQSMSISRRYGKETVLYSGSHSHQQESGCTMVIGRELQQYGQAILLRRAKLPKLWKLCRKPMNMPIISVPRN